MFKREHIKSDGRHLLLYGWEPHDAAALPEAPAEQRPNPHCRWQPLRREWVVYAAHRQERTFKPPAAYCPLCPSHPGEYATEIPFEHFEVAVFENKFPAFTRLAPPAPDLPVVTARADGACEVVVYSDIHDRQLATLPTTRLELLLRVWADRHAALMGRPDIRYVMPFENRGEEVGVTLHHPHGQIYGFPFVPPVVARMAESFRTEPVLEPLLDGSSAAYAVEADRHAVAVVPPFARFPFEIWIAPRARHADLTTLDGAELRSLAEILRRSVARLDGLFGRPMPYILVVYAAPKGEGATFRAHIQILPFLRASGRQKYLAGCEQGAGTFLVDMLPEQMAEQLRGVVLSPAEAAG